MRFKIEFDRLVDARNLKSLHAVPAPGSDVRGDGPGVDERPLRSFRSKAGWLERVRAREIAEDLMRSSRNCTTSTRIVARCPVGAPRDGSGWQRLHVSREQHVPAQPDRRVRMTSGGQP
jgi:hypothetical protein